MKPKFDVGIGYLSVAELQTAVLLYADRVRTLEEELERANRRLLKCKLKCKKYKNCVSHDHSEVNIDAEFVTVPDQCSGQN